LPAVLEPFVEKPLSEKVMAGFNPAFNRVNSSNMKKAKSINVYNFGAKGDGRADDTASIQQAVDTAAETDAELVLPGGLYNISKTIILKENIAIRGLGNACFKSVSGVETLFSGKNVRKVYFANAGFYKVKNAVELTTVSDEQAQILFEHCEFSDIGGVAVSCLSGQGVAGEKNLTDLRITDSVYGIPGQAMVTNANNAVFDYNWLSLYDESKHGTLVNRGTMQVIDNIGVPSVTSKTVWIENYQTLIVDNMRFGGEGPFKKDLIENNSSNGKIYLRYSWLCCDDGSILLCNKVPETAALFANFGTPAVGKNFQTMVTMEQEAKGKSTDFLLESCNIPPTNFK
jgi:hypothetical protein